MLSVEPGDNARLIAPLFRASRGFWIAVAFCWPSLAWAALRGLASCSWVWW